MSRELSVESGTILATTISGEGCLASVGGSHGQDGRGLLGTQNSSVAQPKEVVG